MRRLFLPACLVLLATAPAAFAEDCDRSDDSQSMLNICADADYQAAGARLNAAYKNIVSSNDQASNKLLQTAQRAWIAFRDAECAYSTADSEGGSIHPMEVSQCLTKVTIERTKQLTSGANCKLSDPSCAGSDAGGDDQEMQ
ncbi:lysozyme inhibitor LprI family protein [Mesorhizobium sp. M2A.F.Ca.ET.042.01.1.1]|uniref:lysozyme inhibitor LprI family protein n=1 Tax=Mesorhizobium sp. M2A.F.Ca.ET.042.01.1.1 TaxID=2496745 RepID=UPI000FCAFE94|nr:lysozyme inhibitor LprI family protein [Mesorhizobium sp. M2A.F.Ca.ET.042.01.1.1]RUX30801.1 lysozyme inhibitor LprI family protein [Mesorhizobium sp. M2A.F.Ca.ET.042.01.1.1]